MADEDAERAEFRRRVPDYIQLHQSVQSSTTLLDSLASFLSTFQHDLSDVSGQIFDLQIHSQDIDERSNGRKSIAQPLNALIGEIIIPPSLITTIRDTRPGDAWLPLVQELEDKIVAVKANGRVKAAHEVGMVLEGLKAKAITALRQFLLNMLKPIRASVKTQIHIIQSSILLKYLPFYHFLARQAPRVAQEVQRAYLVAARAYYETCFRRYVRALAVVNAREGEWAEPIGVPSAAEVAGQAFLMKRSAPGPAATRSGVGQSPRDRLRYARIVEDAVDVVPAYEADNKEYKQPVEALFRSLSLVLLDNASAEYTFLVRFFSPPPPPPPTPPTLDMTHGSSRRPAGHTSSPLSSDPGTHPSPSHKFERKDSTLSMASTLPSAEGSPVSVSAPSPLRPGDSVSEAGDTPTIARSAVGSPISRPMTATRGMSLRNGSVLGAGPTGTRGGDLPRDSRREMEALWHQVFDPALEYCETFFKSITEPIAPPPTIPLLTMIRLNDAVLSELDDRGCTPLESMMLGLKLAMWPLFQKQMDSHVDSVKRMADAAGSTGFGAMLGRTGPKDSAVKEVAVRYAHLVSSIVALSEETEEAMLANRQVGSNPQPANQLTRPSYSISRLRAELIRLITQQASKLKNVQDRESFISTIFEEIIRELTSGPGNTGNARLQAELSFFRAREEEARHRMRM